MSKHFISFLQIPAIGAAMAPATSAATPTLAPAPGPSTAGSGSSQTVVATFDLAGQGLSPLSDKDAQALLATVNKTLAAHGNTITSIRLGQVKVSIGRAKNILD